MPVERAGYTVTMFLVDTSPPMGTLKTIDIPAGPNGETRSRTITHLEFALQFVKLKIQEMIFNGRKTDQCGVITFGSEVTHNSINEKNGGYENIQEYIPIGQPNADTLAKVDALKPSTACGDAVDALIVGIETQADYLGSKKSWTRKIVILTNAECPIEIEDWEATVRKMDGLDISLTIIGVDFDDEELPYTEPNKTVHKRENEAFFHQLTSSMKSGIVGNCTFALQEISRPDIKAVRSTLMGTILRLGDVDTMAEEAIEIIVKVSKCTALSRPKSWKKYALREDEEGQAMEIEDDKSSPLSKVVYAPMRMQTEYYIDRSDDQEESEGEDVKMEDDGESDEKKKEDHLEKVEKEELIRGFKYGTTYVPCPEGQFPRLQTRKGIDMCGFFPAKNFHREWPMGEVQYIWADPASPQQQVALSSIVQAMYEKNCMAIARWVTKDGADPKMGVLYPEVFEKVECLLWAQMPFADDIRRYTFASLDNLVTKTGERITKHPYIPTKEQQDAMDNLVDAMDLMTAGEKDEEGNRMPWFSTLDSYNPAIHRTKQAMFHCAVVPDIISHPLPPPHPELTKYFDPPKKVLKRAKPALEECQNVFKVKQIPKRVAKKTAAKKDHDHAQDDEEILLLDRKMDKSKTATSFMNVDEPEPIAESKKKGKEKERASNGDDSDTEDEEDEDIVLVQKPSEDDEEDLLLNKPPQIPIANPNSRPGPPLPTPARSVSPQVYRGKAPGKIIGNTYPLRDFEENIARGDVVTKAVEDLCEVVQEIVMRPFASRRTEELIECLKVLRDTCLKEDEIDQWNTFLPNLKEKCLQKSGNPEFWDELKKIGRGISLISMKEARQHGGAASVSETGAQTFITS